MSMILVLLMESLTGGLSAKNSTSQDTSAPSDSIKVKISMRGFLVLSVSRLIERSLLKRLFFAELTTGIIKLHRDINDQKKMMRELKMHKFSDGTFQRILDKLDHMVKDFKLYEYNKGMETRIWSEDDRRRSKDFIEVTERRLKIQRIFKSLESFVGRILRDVDYRLIQRTE
ncbi:hypothetical protein Tco_1179377 [Tanacetum coccineum]